MLHYCLILLPILFSIFPATMKQCEYEICKITLNVAPFLHYSLQTQRYPYDWTLLECHRVVYIMCEML